MKRLLLILLAITFTVSAQEYKRYQFKSGKIIYESGGSMTGTETLYFDDYGMLETKITKTTLDMMGIKQETNAKVIMKDRWIYSIDEKTNTANKVENPMYKMFPDGIDADKVGSEMMEKMGGKKIGEETINGKECEIWEIKKLMSKVWVWKSLPIKTEINIMEINITQIATSVETDIDIPSDIFGLPKGIKINEAKEIDLNNLMGN